MVCERPITFSLAMQLIRGRQALRITNANTEARGAFNRLDPLRLIRDKQMNG